MAEALAEASAAIRPISCCVCNRALAQLVGRLPPPADLSTVRSCRKDPMGVGARQPSCSQTPKPPGGRDSALGCNSPRELQSQKKRVCCESPLMRPATFSLPRLQSRARRPGAVTSSPAPSTKLTTGAQPTHPRGSRLSSAVAPRLLRRVPPGPLAPEC